jgi:hypothetical protein
VEQERRVQAEAELKRLREENEYLQKTAAQKRDSEKSQAGVLTSSIPLPTDTLPRYRTHSCRL